MLGKLFSTAASTLSPRGSTPSSARPTSTLESVQEDIHTRNLLFPDADTLYQHQHDQVFPLPASTVPILTSSNPFDLNSDIDLDVKDVRVVIMQESTSHMNSATLLFDSHPLIELAHDRQTATSARSVGRASMGSARRVSIGQISKPLVIQESSATRNSGAFDRRPSSHTRTPSYVETDGQRSAREYKEEMAAFSSCMFGSSDIMAYKGTGTKVHILSPESKSSSFPFNDGAPGSLGRSSLRGSKLSQSFTSETVVTGPPSAGLSGTSSGSRTSEKKRVLITRIFPVTLANGEGDYLDGQTPTTTTVGPSSYPFPDVDGDKPPEKKSKPTQKRTPMYAIGLIIQLPTTAHAPPYPAVRSGFRGTGSYTDGDSFPSSFGSSKPAGWAVLGTGFGVESLESSFLSDVDDRIDSITKHWDIIERTLSHIQAVSTKDLLALLIKADLASPNLGSGIFGSQNSRTPTASISISGKRVEETAKPIKLKTNVKWVQLMPNALVHHDNIRLDIEKARQRIASGIKTLQVITRQGRWGIWREEARWVAKWAGGKEQGFFFYNMLTAFLGCHTEWLQALGPDWYKRRHYQQQRANRDEDLPIAARTIVVAQDKMAARRLLFLLSAFLPPNNQHLLPFGRPHRPGTATSFGSYSQSPPSYMPPNLREEPLRRRVNRLNYPKNFQSRAMSFPAPHANGSGANPISETHQDRRSSDASVLKTANLPIPGSEGGTRKSSAATTTTVTPVNTVAHLSNRRPIRGTGPFPRPGSSGSFATEDLMKSLRRNDSSGIHSSVSSDSPMHSRWGSLTSFWSSKRRDSTNATDTTLQSVDGVEISDEQVEDKKGKLLQMVEETKRSDVELAKDGTKVVTEPVVETPEPQTVRLANAYESPVKASINEDDGVVEIDVPLPDFITSSFDSAISSPSSSGILSSRSIGPGLEGFEHYSPYGPDEDNPLNVGGWLPAYHPDFVLQAIPNPDRKGYSLEEDIKSSMQAEPTPAVITMHESSQWVDVSTALIADASTFTIKRLRLRRLIRRKSFADANASAPSSFESKSFTQSMYGNPYLSQPTPVLENATTVIEERFTSEPVICMDETLTEAVERIVTQTGHQRPLTAPGSGSSSRERSRVRDADKEREPERKGKVEVPRGECKKILLSALEEITKEVTEARAEDNVRSDGRTSSMHREESLLREGIRCWLKRVEDGG